MEKSVQALLNYFNYVDDSSKLKTRGLHLLDGEQLLEGSLAGVVDDLLVLLAKLVTTIGAGVHLGLERSLQATETDVVLAGQGDGFLQEAEADDAAEDLRDVVVPGLVVRRRRRRTVVVFVVKVNIAFEK